MHVIGPNAMSQNRLRELPLPKLNSNIRPHTQCLHQSLNIIGKWPPFGS